MNELWGKEIKKQYLYNSIRKKRNLGINFTKDVKDLYTEN